jgi:hypothetical protein
LDAPDATAVLGWFGSEPIPGEVAVAARQAGDRIGVAIVHRRVDHADDLRAAEPAVERNAVQGRRALVVRCHVDIAAVVDGVGAKFPAPTDGQT